MDLFLGDFIKHTTYEESQQSRHMVEEKETESLTVGQTNTAALPQVYAHSVGTL